MKSMFRTRLRPCKQMRRNPPDPGFVALKMS